MCLGARFHVTVFAVVNCMQISSCQSCLSRFCPPRSRTASEQKRGSSFLRFCLVVLSLANVIWGKLKTETDVECAGWEESVCVRVCVGGGGGETKCWSEKVKSLLFFCPTPVARPLPPPLSSQSCSPGERTEGKTYKSCVSRVSPVSALLCKLMYFVCSFAYSWKKKGRGPHKGGKNPALSSQTKNFHCKWCCMILFCCFTGIYQALKFHILWNGVH